MRRILSESDEQQIQGDENGREFIYRKDFISTGDRSTEYSLALMYSRKSKILTTGEEDKND